MATLSQVRAWSTEHLIEAAGYWTKTADQWEDVFLRMRNQSHTLVWEGAGGDALRQRTGADFAVVSAKAEQLRQASKIAPVTAPEPSAPPNAGSSLLSRTPITRVLLSQKTSRSPIPEPAAPRPNRRLVKPKPKHSPPTSANASPNCSGSNTT
ncbi:hypothetical protein LAUMK142_04885 [Mycobacterium pseudokansasii]|uniref:Uncharacterized protein n=1 Tax=Mycobacterium pseudokansasii TaxID=2341080 RepID=A0A498QZ12_9MYCO|nr:hypothetical protein LAUMK142_04885 [Mycobacterium pseudokansasii]